MNAYDDFIVSAQKFWRRVRAHVLGANVHYNNGRRLFHQKRFDEAIVELDKVCRIDPKNQWAPLALGIVSEAKKDFAGALGYYEKAIELSPRFAQAFLGKGQALAALGRPRESIDAYKAFLVYTDRADSEQIEFAEKEIARLEKQ
jgi:tetratricopeptide (TPR) repeat protein